jgi:hypothetical protein
MIKKIKTSKSFPIFFVVSYFILVALVIGSSLFYYNDRKNVDETFYKSREIDSVNNMKILLNSEVNNIISDLKILASSSAISDYIKNVEDIEDLSILKNEFLSFALFAESYDQVRLLDGSGMEIIRVNGSAANAKLIPDNQLQSKSDRYYFTDSIKLNNGDIYVSPFDLNVENGIVETPVKPVIRFATPVVYNTKRSVLVLNYLGDKLMDLIHDASYFDSHMFYVLNNDGYWLHNPDTSLEWGFMFPDKVDNTLAKIYPDFWEKIKNSEIQFLGVEGLYTTTKIKPAYFSEENALTFVSFVPNELLYRNSTALAKFLMLVDGFLIILVSVSLLSFIKLKR